jgi:hypothetical protein
MIKIVVKPNSERADSKWIPAGMIVFPNSGTQIEHAERYYENKFDTKEEADRYFVQASNKKYKIK